MEALSEKRARLRHELQQAYRAWMLTAELWMSATANDAARDAARAKWIDYLAAKERLAMAGAKPVMS